MHGARLDKEIKALVLLSGGLDSRLAIKLVRAEGIEVTALHFMTLFCNCTSKGSCKLEAQKAADDEGIEVKVLNMTQEFLKVIEKPKYGYGSGINPCLDCRILMFGKARELMKELGASFIVTGEVLGERPMSQRMEAMQIIERDSGLGGLILRPLSAQLFPPSFPEKEGWIDREKLLAIRGRSRKPQIQLAKELGLNDYPCPAGGCLLTDSEFAKKMRDLMAHEGLVLNDVALLKLGRHFRINEKTKAVVGRNDLENKQILTLAKPQDQLFELAGKPGPITLLRGEIQDETKKLAAGLTIYYSKSRESKREQVKLCSTMGEESVGDFSPLSQAEVEKIKV